MKDEHIITGGTEQERIEMIRSHAKRKVAEHVSDAVGCVGLCGLISFIAYMVLR